MLDYLDLSYLDLFTPVTPHDKPESLLSTLLVPRGFDTLEYSKVKATSVSVRLRIYSVRLRTVNSVPSETLDF